MSGRVAESYRACQQVVRNSGSNFAMAFWLLPRPQRQAMNALYAFARHTDDLGDEPGDSAAKYQALAAWQEAVASAVEKRPVAVTPGSELLPALVDAVERYAIPPQLLHDVIAGVRTDISGPDFKTWDELARYCYLVAGAVGVACLHIWGYPGDEALPYATACGEAFQLTNILRDLREDAGRGRVYLPAEELDQLGYHRDQILKHEEGAAFSSFMAFQLQRTRRLYAEAAKLTPHLSPCGRRVYRLMYGRYRAILAEIERNPRQVWQQRVCLSPLKKVSIALRQLTVPSI